MVSQFEAIDAASPYGLVWIPSAFGRFVFAAIDPQFQERQRQISKPAWTSWPIKQLAVRIVIDTHEVRRAGRHIVKVVERRHVGELVHFEPLARHLVDAGNGRLVARLIQQRTVESSRLANEAMEVSIIKE